MSKIELDKTDRKILAILQADGRLSNQDVAERVNLSPSPCLRRIKRLEEAGVIRQYVALLDADKLGLGLLAYVNVRLEKHSEGAPNARVPATSPRFEFAAGRRGLAGSGGLLCDDGGHGFPAARARGRHGPLLALHDGDAAAPSVGAGREVELCLAADQGDDGAAGTRPRPPWQTSWTRASSARPSSMP
jgi:hypothetical protein